MKKILIFIVVLLSVYPLHAQKTAQQELDRAIYLEEVDGNLDQALDLYQKIIKDFKENRSVVAEALYRTGLVNEKLGNQKAVSYYENIVKNYSDQSRQVAMARKRLNTIYAAMNVNNEEEDVVSLSKIYSAPGYMIGSISHNGEYYCAYENLNLYLYDLTSGKKSAITTKGRSDSVSINALPGAWSMDDTKVAFSWHHGKDVYSLEIWDRIKNKVNTAVEPGDYINPINWSYDGGKILVEFGPDKEVPNFGILSLEDGSRQNLRALGQLNRDLANMSPDGNFVIFTQDSERGDKDLYMYRVVDQSSHLISNHSANEKAFWAYDGKSIIIQSERSGNPALYQWEFKNGNLVGDPQLIYDGINKGFNAAQICKNGEILLSNRHTQSSIYNAIADFQEGKIIENYEFFDNASDYNLPTWSPDGKWIAMYKKGNSPSSTNLVIADLKGIIHKNIELGFFINSSNDFMNRPIWTPEGKIVVPFDRSDAKKLSELVMVDLEQGTKESFVPPHFIRPVFASNDLYYLSLTRGWTNAEEYGILKVNRVTNEQELIYRCTDNNIPGPWVVLSPDKNKLLFRIESKLMLMDLQDYSVKEVFNSQRNGFWPPTWYPDSRKIQFDMVGIDSKTGLQKDGEEVAVELDTYTGDYQVLPRLPLGKDESIPWRTRNIKYMIHPDGKYILYTKANVTTNFWVLKYQ